MKNSNEKQCESEDNFTVQCIGRTDMRYAEAGRSVTIYFEFLNSGPYQMAIEKASFKHWDDDAESIITEEERDRIIDNIRHALVRERIYSIEIW